MGQGFESPLRLSATDPVDSAARRRDTGPVNTGNAELVRSSFDAFLRGDWDALSRTLDPGVQWLWYGASPSGDCRAAKRAWW